MRDIKMPYVWSTYGKTGYNTAHLLITELVFIDDKGDRIYIAGGKNTWTGDYAPTPIN
jgi:hypothetical protein